MTHLDDLTDALDTLRADDSLSSKEWANILIGQGWVKKNPEPVAIKEESLVEVLFRGDWVPGRVLSIGPGGLLDVAHERGSISVYAKGGNVRPPRKK